jgi:hypothetical protein
MARTTSSPSTKLTHNQLNQEVSHVLNGGLNIYIYDSKKFFLGPKSFIKKIYFVGPKVRAWAALPLGRPCYLVWSTIEKAERD